MEDMILGLVNFTDAERLAAANLDERSLLMFTGGNLSTTEGLAKFEQEITDWLDNKSTAEFVGIEPLRSKREGFSTAEQASDLIAGMFIVFGSFTIIAGMLLVVNIFVMLGEERKSEMGMTRALGMQRPDLRAMFVLEGSLIAAISSAIGALFGLVVAYMVAKGFSLAISSVNSSSNGFTYSWEWSSIAAGFAFGFLVTWLTLWLTSFRNSRMNVVAAMRDLPRTISKGVPWWAYLVLIGLFGTTLVCLFGYFLILLTPNKPNK